MAKLAPSILSADFSKLGEDVKTIEKAGAHIVHVDVMDGHFVPNITYGAPVMKCLVGKTEMPFDVHLMIENPEKYIGDFACPNTEYITVHVEAAGDTAARLEQIHQLGYRAGLAINPETPVEEAFPYLEAADMFLVMSVHPGFGGQKFIGEVLEKVKTLDAIRKEKGLDFEIEMDGGIGLDNVGICLEAGCDIIVAGSSVFKAEDVPKRVADFLEVM